MAKTYEPHRLELDSYPYSWTIDTAFGDMDVAGHINNIALVRYYETGRTRWLLRLTEDRNVFRGGHFNAVVAQYTVRFFGEVNFPDQVVVASGIGRIGNSSFTSRQALFQNGRCVGLSDAAMALAIGGKSAVIEEKLQEKMTAYLVAGSQG